VLQNVFGLFRGYFPAPILDLSMRIALFQPDIPGNAGALMRTAACLEVPVDIIGPCGFVLSDKQMRRAGMDYLGKADMTEHASWNAFQAARLKSGAGRLIGLSTKAETDYLQFTFRRDDILLAGRESAGLPDEVHAACAARVRVPMAAGLRSLNVATALGMVLGEALRQTDGFPKNGPKDRPKDRDVE